MKRLSAGKCPVELEGRKTWRPVGGLVDATQVGREHGPLLGPGAAASAEHTFPT